MKRIIYNVERLKEPCEPLTFISDTGIDKNEGISIIQELTEVMEGHKKIIALAAPQIGIKKRIFCIRFNDVIKFFINPIVTKKQGNVIGPENFLSLKGKEILVARPEEISTVYYNKDFKYEDNKLLGPAARIFDQMYQLLDGVCPDDIGLVSDIEADGSLFDITDEEELKAITDCYKQFVAAKAKALEDEIKSDETNEKIYNSLRFTESVINGKTTVVDDGTPVRKENRETRRAKAKQNRRIMKKLAKEVEGVQ